MLLAEPIWAGGHVAAYIGRTHDRFRTAIKSCTFALELNGPSTHGLIWQFYADLKTYRLSPTRRRRRELRARFDRIFRRRTGFVTLDRLLQRLHANKAELLMVLDHPEIPLHTNGSENDIRCQVTKRQVSGGTHSDIGRDCRNAFLGLGKTCRKLGIAFWNYLGARLGVRGSPAVPHLADFIRCRAQPA